MAASCAGYGARGLIGGLCLHAKRQQQTQQKGNEEHNISLQMVAVYNNPSLESRLTFGNSALFAAINKDGTCAFTRQNGFMGGNAFRHRIYMGNGAVQHALFQSVMQASDTFHTGL